MKDLLENKRASYGNPQYLFSFVAKAFNSYMEPRVTCTPMDIVMLLRILKIGREIYGRFNRDNLADQIGYAAIHDFLEQRTSQGKP